jgi:uncharacterized membrane protein YphA (DoxX/SURF4 family)
MDTIRETLEVSQPDPSGSRWPASTGRADQLPGLLLRGGLAFAFLYAATASFLHPTTFARYFPSFMPGAWAAELLPAFAVYEVVLSALLLTNRFTYTASLLAAATLLGIVVVNPDAFEVLFRNVALACAALALALQDRQQRMKPHPPPP